MKKIFHAFVLAGVILSLSGCFVNRHTIADGPIGKESSVRYSHAKQVYLFWGLIALGHPQPATPQLCGYQIKTAYNGVDMLINLLTGGIVGTRNIKVLVKPNSECNPKGRK